MLSENNRFDFCCGIHLVGEYIQGFWLCDILENRQHRYFWGRHL